MIASQTFLKLFAPQNRDSQTFCSINRDSQTLRKHLLHKTEIRKHFAPLFLKVEKVDLEVINRLKR